MLPENKKKVFLYDFYIHTNDTYTFNLHSI